MANIFFPTTDNLISGVFVATFGCAPGATYLSQARTLGAVATAQVLINASGAQTPAALAALVMGKLGVTTAMDTNSALLNYLTGVFTTAGVANSGQALVDVVTAFPSLGNHPVYSATYGTAADAFAGQTNTASAYSAVATNNSTDITVLAAVVGTAGVVAGQTFTLTTGIDIKTGTTSADTFDGSVNANGTATLTSVDVLDGGAGTDILIAEMAGGNIAPTVKNIESVEIIGGGAAASTFNMVNVSNAPTLLVRNSSQAVTIDSLAGATMTLRDQAANLSINVTNASAVGANNTFTLNLSGAQSDGDGGSTVAITQMAGADTTGIETVALDSGGTSANFLNALTSVNGANSRITTLNVTGAQALTIATALNASVTTLGASATTAGVTASFAATDAATLTGGSGNDALTLTASAGAVSVVAGAGDDLVRLMTVATFTTADSIDGGAGTADRLSVIAADAEGITAALTNTIGFEQLSLNTAGTAAASINATRFGTIDTVRLDAGTLGTYGVTMAAGAKTLGVASTNETLANTLTVTDTGTATTDALTIVNRNTTSATNNFNGVAITSAGYEAVTVNTGSDATAAQSLGAITITGDATNTAQSITVTGANALTLNAAPSSNSSAVFSINASGMTAQAAGTATFTMAAAPTFAGVTGTVSITGSAGQDVLLGHATAASTIDGGAGVDTVTGGSAADSLTGGTGNDSITGAGGNDTVSGGDGVDTIVMTAAGTVTVDGGAGNDTVNMGATLSASDSIVGGADTDALSISTAAVTASVAAGVSGFETLTFDATGGATQDMVQFTGNTGFTRLNFGATAGNTNGFSNVSSSVTTLGLGNVALTSGTMTRLVDTTADTLTVNATGLTAARTVTALSIANEETVTISGAAAAGDLTITTLTANDMTSLTVTGAADLTITNAIASAASLATINAVAATGTISLNASTSVVDMTITGSLSAANTLTGGTGADVITGGDVADTLTGGNGADNITGGGGADSLLGGIGNDIISGGIGDDTITGGTGNDSITFGDGADDAIFAAVGSNGVDTITDFVTGTDDIDMTTSVAGGDVTIVAAAVEGAFTANGAHYISTNGAAANLTTAGTATLNVADLTATTLTNLAAYLDERFTIADTNTGVIALNWTAGGNVTTYIYEVVDSATVNVTLDANELTLTGVVTHAADAILAAGDLI